MIRFVVVGKPRGKGRPRFTKRGSYVQAYTPKETKQYEEEVLSCWMKQSHLSYGAGIPLKAKIAGYFPIPKGFSKKRRAEINGKPYTGKVDVDNLAKVILDALNGIAFHDDAQITRIEVSKEYAETGRVEVMIGALDENSD